MDTIKFTYYSTIFSIAFPVILSQASVTLCTLTDLCFLRQFGTVAIAAISIANIIIATFFNFLEGFRTGTSVIVSSHVGEKKPVYPILNTAFLFTFLLSLLICALSACVSRFTYNHFSSLDLLEAGYDYLRIWLCSVPFTLIFYVFVGYCRGYHNTLLPLYITLEICLLNAAFDYLFIAVYGVKGAALATVVANGLGALTLGWILLLKTPLTLTQIFKLATHGFYSFLDFSKLLFHIGFYTGFVNIALLIFVCFISHLGNEALAAHHIAFQIFLLCYLPAIGFLVSASVIIPRLLTEESYTFIIPVCHKIMRIGLFFSTLIGISIFVFASPIAGFFSQDTHVKDLATWLIKSMAFIQFITCWNMIMRGILTGLRETQFIAQVGVFSGYVVFIPLTWIACHYGLKTCYVAFAVWCLSDALLFGYKFLHMNLKKYVKHGS